MQSAGETERREGEMTREQHGIHCLLDSYLPSALLHGAFKMLDYGWVL